MPLRVDLNADMGESFGPWVMGNDAALLEIVSSANIACGFHAGDPDVMAQTMGQAAKNKVGIGAHPGFADLQGFGRRRLELSLASLEHLVQYQLGAALAMARATGGSVRHLKLHGALANMASENEQMAHACYHAALQVDPDLILLVLAGTAQEQAARKLGGLWAAEIFADRAYNDDCTLVDRKLPGAVLHDPQSAATRIVGMVQAGAIIAQSGKHIATPIDSICLHGDGAEAVAMARAVRQALMDADVQVQAFAGRRG